MPFWVLEVWEGLRIANRKQEQWATAVNFLKEQNCSEVINMLQTIPWNAHLPPGMGSDIDLLGWYCLTRWLSDAHMDQMGTLLEDRLHSEGRKTVSILPVFFINKLIRTFCFAKETYPTSQSARHLRDLGDQLSTQKITSVTTYVCVSLLNRAGESLLPSMYENDIGNHWISVIIDITESCIWVGDSKGCDVPVELMEVLVWWLGSHSVSKVFEKKPMECTIQADAFSCSVLCHNALEHHLFPLDVVLVPAEDALSERTRILHRIITYVKSVVSRMRNEQFKDTDVNKNV